jgi:hypothetical protein
LTLCAVCRCVSGQCIGDYLCANKTCPAISQCHGVGTCDYSTGACSTPVLADSTTCNDGDNKTVSKSTYQHVCLTIAMEWSIL